MSAFEWDTEKNRARQRKHGISFEEASTIFNAPVLCGEHPGGHDEIRERSYGLLGGTVVVCVVHTERGAPADHQRPQGDQNRTDLVQCLSQKSD